MKKISNILIFIFFNSLLFSEEYICTGSMGPYKDTDNRKYSQMSYKRSGNKFIKEILRLSKEVEGEKRYVYVLKETDSFIILYQTYNFPCIWNTIINKDNGTFSETFICDDSVESLTPSTGTCIVRD